MNRYEQSWRADLVPLDRTKQLPKAAEISQAGALIGLAAAMPIGWPAGLDRDKGRAERLPEHDR